MALLLLFLWEIISQFIYLHFTGGVIVNVMREENTRKFKEYTKLRPLCAKWEEQGLWRRLEETVPEDVKYYEDDAALVQVYQVV